MDDGSLKYLNIDKFEAPKMFRCKLTNQTKLLNKTFWVLDFIENVHTKYSRINKTEGKTLVEIKLDINSEHSRKKFFTGSLEINYILNEIKRMDKFPRSVTLRRNEYGEFYFE